MLKRTLNRRKTRRANRLRSRRPLRFESLEHRQLLAACGLTPAAAPVDQVAIPAFVTAAEGNVGKADAIEFLNHDFGKKATHSKAATGSKLDATKGDGIVSCGSSFPVAQVGSFTDLEPPPEPDGDCIVRCVAEEKADRLSGDTETWPVAGERTKDSGTVTSQRPSVAIPAFAIAEAADAEGLTDKDRAYFDVAAQREDWTIIGNPSLESMSSNIDTEYQELFDADSHRDGWTIIGNPSIRVDAGETGLEENFQSILPDEDTFPLATTLKDQTPSAVVAGQKDTVPVGTTTNVDTSRYEEIADSQQSDPFVVIVCVLEADNVENPTDESQDSFDADTQREDWTIVGNPSLESTSSNHESHTDGLVAAGQPEGWMLGGKPSLDGYEDTSVIGALETVDPNANDAIPTPVTTTMDAVVNASSPYLPLLQSEQFTPLATEAKLNKSSLPETDCTGGEIELGHGGKHDGGELTLYGTECHDVGQVNYYGANEEFLQVHLNGQVWGLPSSAVNLVTFIGYDGDDFFRNLTSIASLQFGDNGNDILFGGGISDEINGGKGSDTISGGWGDDTLHGDDGHDTIRGGRGVDTIYGDGGHDWIYGDQGNDILYGGFAADKLFGGTGADRMYGKHGDDTLRGQGGNDTLVGGDGNDDIQGGAGRDTIRGNNGHDILDGGSGADSIRGGNGNDELCGGDDNDVLYGNAGDDNLHGESGNDGLFGGGGNNILEGGAGADRFLYFANDTILDQANSDAAIHFVDGEGTWLDTEVIAVDAALQNLHDLTGNTTLLERENGCELTFERLGSSADDVSSGNLVTLAYNVDSTQTISFYDQAFYWTDSDGILDWTQFRSDVNVTVYHEIAHNWDDENDDWSDFKDLSDWGPRTDFGLDTMISRDGLWSYSRGTEFAHDYGRTNPREDFATSFAFFICSQTGEDYPDGDGETNAETQDRIQDKWDFMDAFVTSL